MFSFDENCSGYLLVDQIKNSKLLANKCCDGVFVKET